MEARRPRLIAKDKHAEAVDQVVARLLQEQQILGALSEQLSSVMVKAQDAHVDKVVAKNDLLAKQQNKLELLASAEKILAESGLDDNWTDLLALRASKYPAWYIKKYNLQQHNHEERLIAIKLDAEHIPKRYICPLTLEVADEPAVLEYHGSSKDVLIQHMFEYVHIKDAKQNPLNRAPINTLPAISVSLQNIIATFVAIHEIRSHLAERELTRRSLLMKLDDSEQRREMLLSNMELLQKLGIGAGQIPDHLLSPTFHPDASISPTTIFSFPVIISSNEDDEITIDFHELLRYQAFINQKSDADKEAVLQQEIRRQTLELNQQQQSDIHVIQSNTKLDAQKKEEQITARNKKYAIDLDRLKALTYAQLDIPAAEFVHPFSGKILEHIKIDYRLIHEVDIFMLICQLEKFAEVRNKLLLIVAEIHQAQNELQRHTTLETTLLAEVKELQLEIDNHKNNIAQLDIELKSAILAGEFAAVENAVRNQNEKAQNGVMLNGAYWTHPPQSYAELVKATPPKQELQEELRSLEVGLIPGQAGVAELTSHPVKLDGTDVIDYERLVAFWNSPQSSFLGLWKSKVNHAGLNPFTGKPIETIAYDYALKAKTDRFMARCRYFPEAKTVVITREEGRFGWSLPMPKRMNRNRDSENNDGPGKMGPK